MGEKKSQTQTHTYKRKVCVCVCPKVCLCGWGEWVEGVCGGIMSVYLRVDNVRVGGCACVCWSPISLQTPVNSINIYCVLCARPCSQYCGLYQDKSYKVPGFGELTIRITHIWLAPFPLQGNFQAELCHNSGWPRPEACWNPSSGGWQEGKPSWGMGSWNSSRVWVSKSCWWPLGAQAGGYGPSERRREVPHQKSRVPAALACSSVIRQPASKPGSVTNYKRDPGQIT